MSNSQIDKLVNKARTYVRAVQLEPELKVIEEACQRFVASYGGVTGR